MTEKDLALLTGLDGRELLFADGRRLCIPAFLSIEPVNSECIATDGELAGWGLHFHNELGKYGIAIRIGVGNRANAEYIFHQLAMRKTELDFYNGRDMCLASHQERQEFKGRVKALLADVGEASCSYSVPARKTSP